MTQPGASCWGQSLFGWDRGRKEGDGDVLLDHVVVHYHAVDIHINGGGGQGAGEVLEEGEGGESGGGRKHCHRVAEKEVGMWLFIAPKCVKSQNQLPFHTIKSSVRSVFWSGVTDKLSLSHPGAGPVCTFYRVFFFTGTPLKSSKYIKVNLG